MGKRRGRLRALGFKYVPRKIWINKGFGDGYYKYVKPIQLPDTSALVSLCESKDGMNQWTEPYLQPSLENMGFQRNETGKIVPIMR